MGVRGLNGEMDRLALRRKEEAVTPPAPPPALESTPDFAFLQALRLGFAKIAQVGLDKNNTSIYHH